ncbi:MAG: sensor domain-containing diguanylate cyclase, partial [Alphaproteobacteria bacterium]|nr:sensor domain-containing diguanylate cyclase [Alphaproteobacteria bacterium]
DKDRQWFKSAIGMDTLETPREQAFCDLTIRREDVLVIPDACEDTRTAKNPLVTRAPYIRFYAGAPLITPENARLGSLCLIDQKPRDLTQREQKVLAGLAALVMDELALRRQTQRDWLTGAMSRGAFHALASRSLQSGRRSHPYAGIISFDIDHFKKLNDNHGHLAGDKVLINVVQTCQGALRNCDHLARVGGEEFAILLPNMTRDMIMSVCERLRKSIETLRIPSLGGEIQVTASFGATLIGDDDETIEHALQRADVALYRSKSDGRNRISYA